MAAFDVIISNGSIIDGSGGAAQNADVGIRGDVIERVGDLSDAESDLTIAAAGRVVAPGFVDVHNHSDAWLLKIPHLLPKTMQGFTTEVIMADGISYAPVNDNTRSQWIYYLRSLNALQSEEDQGWQTLEEYMACLQGRNVQNSITHIPYANLRTMACGFGRQVPDDFQMLEIVGEVEKGMEAGAVGLSTGLDYLTQCFATTDELVEASEAMSAHRGLYVTHVRYKKGTLAGVKEAVEIGRRADVPVHISHLKATRPEEIDAILEYVDQTARNEVDFSFDVYPYLPGSTMLNYLLPSDLWEDGPQSVLERLSEPRVRAQFERSLAPMDLNNLRIAWLAGSENSRHIGTTLQCYVDHTGRSVGDALSDLLIEEDLAVLLVSHHDGDDNLVHPFLAHDCYMMGTDGIYFPDGLVHPRMYGSAPRLLGPCVRDHRLFSLEEAVRKLSGYPAERFGLARRGLVRESYYADLVIFDPETVVDRATFSEPHQTPQGIEHVLINGVPVISDGREVEDLADPLPGRSLKFRC